MGSRRGEAGEWLGWQLWAWSPRAKLASMGGLSSPDRVEGKGRPQGAVRTLAASAPCAVVCAQKTEKRVPGMLAWVTAVIESCLPLTISSISMRWEHWLPSCGQFLNDSPGGAADRLAVLDFVRGGHGIGNRDDRAVAIHRLQLPCGEQQRRS